MADETGAFAVQEEVQAGWRQYIDGLAPLRPDLFRYCCGLTGNIWDGEDLVQDVLARTFSQMGKVNAQLTHPRAYLIRAATNVWTDRLRRLRLERAYAEDAQAEPPPETADASQVVDVRAAAAGLFLHLAPQERATVLLAEVLDLALEETASMLKTTVGAVKSALSRGRARLRAAQAAPPSPFATPRDVVDRFVAALTNKDFDAIRALCLADVTVDMCGGPTLDGYETGKATVEHAHVVAPQFGLHADPRWEAANVGGEWVAIGFRTQDRVEGLNEVWRFEVGEGGVSRLRLYCFCPDVLAAVGRELGVPVLRRPYRSWPCGPGGPPMRPEVD